MRALMITGGMIHLAFVAFHVLLPRLANWKESLALLDADNRAVMYIFNNTTIYIVLAFAFLSIFHWRGLLASGLGRAVTVIIALFWLVRAVEQVIYFGPTQGVVITIVCAATGIMYLIPIFAGSGVPSS